MKYLRGSIKYKLLVIMLLISFVSIVSSYIVFVTWYVMGEHQKKIELSKTITNVLSQNFAKLIFLEDIKEASDITTILHSYSDIERLVLYNKAMKVIYRYEKNHKKFKIKKLQKEPKQYAIVKDNRLLLLDKIYYQKMQLGYIYEEIKTESIQEIIVEDLPFLIFIMFFLILLSFMLSLYYSKSFIKPILKLVTFLDTIDLYQDKEQKIDSETDSKEFLILYHKINELLQKNRDANESQRIASVAFEIDNAMMITDQECKVLQVNSFYTVITGFTQSDVLGSVPPVFKHKMETEEFYKNIDAGLEEFRYWSGDIKSKRKDGSLFIEHLSIHAVTNEKNEVLNYILSFLDVTKQKELEDKLKFLQEYDSLTGLANKTLALKKVQQNMSKYGVFISFDIRRFKEINNFYGYETGDILLKEVSTRIKKAFSHPIVISRIDSNKFIIYNLYENDNREEILIESKMDAEYLLNLVENAPFLIKEKSFFISVVIGITLVDTQDNAENILDKGLLVLERAKEESKSIVFFNKEIEKYTFLQINLYSQLLMAIKDNEFELYYQLQYNEFKDPYGAESLLRWNHPEEGVISPSFFIPLAEKTGLISQIGRLVLRLACEQLVQWQKNEKTKDLILSVNLGAKHFQEDDFLQQLQDIVEAYDIPLKNLKIELTEYTMIDDIHKTAKKMEALRELGIKISLDDFGTGFSSLQYLQLLPINQLKIDQTFVMNMFNNKTNIAIIKSIIILAEALDIEVIAEGVENEKIYKKLSELGCKYFQGYYFARPEKIQKVERKLLS